jgi:Fe-S cluster assembly protein SufD
MSSVVERGNSEARTERYVAAFEAFEDRRPAGPDWARRLRRAAITAFAKAGLPTTRDEEYRFTNIGPIAATAFELAPETAAVRPDDVAPHLYPEAAADLVFVNGRFTPALSRAGSLPDGLMVTTLAEALAERPGDIEPFFGHLAASQDVAFSALNTAFAEDGAVVSVSPGAVIEAPVNLVFVSTGGTTPLVCYPRVLLIAGEHSQSRFIETHLGMGEGVYFSCAVTEAACGPGAVMDYYRVQIEQSHGYHYCRLAVRTERAANFLSHAFSLGGAIVRNDMNAVMDGEGGDCTLNGLYLADDDTLVDNHTTIDHAQPHCGSHEVYKGILGGRARGVFNGKIIVRPDAQKTDAKQTNKALLLSGSAQINTKPQLEIFADDVKCTHGATVGQLDPDSMFYLRSRGLGIEAARALLIRGFAGDIVNRVAFQPLRERLDARLLAQIPQDSVA